MLMKTQRLRVTEFVPMWPKLPEYRSAQGVVSPRNVRCSRAAVARLARRCRGDSVRVSCGELAESLGDRVDGRLAGDDVDHEVVDVVVAGA